MNARTFLALVFVAGLVTAACGDRKDPREGLPVGLAPNALLAANRSELAVCVETVSGASIDVNTAVDQIEAGLATLRDMEDWGQTGYPSGTAVVDDSCPSDPYLLEELPYAAIPADEPPRQAVKEASPYRLFVFVLPPEKLNGLGEDTYTPLLETQEVLCKEDLCGVVSTALYLSDIQASDASYLAESLKSALGVGPQPR